MSGPPNAFALIAGIVRGGERDRLLGHFGRLRGPHGWRLFDPPLGRTPIPSLGRMGSGDLRPGLGENGTSYNHGAHGFLGCAAATCGRGDLLYEVLRAMMPYDPAAHPSRRTLTAPYAMVNHWREAPGHEGEGGEALWTGSVGLALRLAYRGLLGVRPEVDGLVIDPVVPTAWRHLSGHHPYLGCRVEVVVRNPNRRECGVAAALLDGESAGRLRLDRAAGREVLVIAPERFATRRRAELVVTLG
jgi:cellobiose phosphorylase